MSNDKNDINNDIFSIDELDCFIEACELSDNREKLYDFLGIFFSKVLSNKRDLVSHSFDTLRRLKLIKIDPPKEEA